MSELTYREAADHLNVSPATIKNWTRQGLLSAENQLNFQESDIIHLKNKITSHESTRLSSRANKSSAIRKFIPTEYIENRISRKAVNQLSLELKSINVTPATFLFALSLLLIEKAGLMTNRNFHKKKLPEIHHIGLSREMNNWYRLLNKPSINKLISQIDAMPIPEQRDTSGLIYQMLQSEGRKSEKGSYYTPPSYADEVLGLYGTKGQKFLDPCCGSGMFLLAAAKKYGSPENIHGWDTDNTAVHLARINIMLYFSELQFEPQIYHRNCLVEEINEKYDLIATNPPWGLHFNPEDQKVIKQKFKSIKTGESFSYFIEAGLKLLKKGGVLSYMLPEAFLKVKTHKDIRGKIQTKAHIKYIKYMGRPFHRVQTEVIRVDMTLFQRKGYSTVFRNNKIYSVDTERFNSNTFNLFDFNCNNTDYEIINKIYRKKHKTLKNNAIWILGIVSGNNEKFITDLQKEGHKRFICGKDIESFKLKKPERFIYFNRKILQQSAPLESYEKSPKIVYKFITDKPSCAIDRTGYLTLNSANSFYPQLNYPIEVITALFNSKLYQFLFRKKFNSIKVLRSHLEQLPLPSFNNENYRKIVKLTQKIETCDIKIYKLLIDELDMLIFELFHITDGERKYILGTL